MLLKISEARALTWNLQLRGSVALPIELLQISTKCIHSNILCYPIYGIFMKGNENHTYLIEMLLKISGARD
jgi:hypothetical protein